MNCEIIAVGTELLLGNILNTNARYLSNQLSGLGINVFYQTVVGDNDARLASAISVAANRADLLILTGGLGPTNDDLTKETVCKFLNAPLELHQESLDRMTAHFKKVNREMPQSNIKQAMLPRGCTILPNDNGTAPGCIIESGEVTVAMLPGPPKEMQLMFESYLHPYLRAKSPYTLVSKTLRIFGIGESAVDVKLEDIMDVYNNPTVAPYAKEGEVHLRITARGHNEQEGVDMIAPVEAEIRNRLGICVYGTDEADLATVVCDLLKQRDMSIATAESCTGGLLSGAITAVAGSSEVFAEGFVTYSNLAKNVTLGVKDSTLKKYGAVSEQTAIEMSVGLMRRTGAGISVAVTGIAGPGGGSAKKPVGLVYVGIATSKFAVCKTLQLSRDRAHIRHIAVMSALDAVRKILINM